MILLSMPDGDLDNTITHCSLATRGSALNGKGDWPALSLQGQGLIEHQYGSSIKVSTNVENIDRIQARFLADVQDAADNVNKHSHTTPNRPSSKKRKQSRSLTQTRINNKKDPHKTKNSTNPSASKTVEPTKNFSRCMSR